MFRKPERKYNIERQSLQNIMGGTREEGLKKLGELGGPEKVLELLETSTTEGISFDKQELERRKAVFGTNELPKEKHESFFKLMWEAAKDTTLIILELAAIVSLVLTFTTGSEESDNIKNLEWIEGVSILLTAVIVIIVSAFNDWSKDKQFRKLQKRVDLDCKIAVIRGGETQEIPIIDILVGDICKIRYGDMVPADGILLEANGLSIDESSLTGESDHIQKEVSGDCLLLSGTYVMEGSGSILVIAVGPYSQIGVIMALLNEKKEKDEDEGGGGGIGEQRSILQAKLTKLAIQIGFAGALAAVVTGVALTIYFSVQTFAIEKREWQDSYARKYINFFMMAVTILVVAVPEGLPLAVTLSLAYSMKRMMKDNVLVRHLGACETMGNATIICSDKTGTLTTNRMTVVASHMCGNMFKTNPDITNIPEHFLALLTDAIAINTAYTTRLLPPDQPGEQDKTIGNKTECAMLKFCQELGKNYESIRRDNPESTFAYVYTFNSERKSMTTVVKYNTGFRIFTKGASEVVLLKCSRIIGHNGSEENLTADSKQNLVEKVINVMAADGLRTLCLAYRDVYTNEDRLNFNKENDIVTDLTCLCILGIEDPLRAEVTEAIGLCYGAGLRIIMVTGDNVLTGRSIAIKAGIINPEEKEEQLVLDGKEFNYRARDDQGVFKQHLLDKFWPKLKVLARASPVDKYNLVSGIIDSKITANQEVVAVTGDGTNDGPALRRADVGFAMGIAGTAVAKEASDIIITDDNFSSIVKAVMWGRNVHDSIGKFIQFQLTVNVVACGITLIAALAIHDTPINVIQMLWINLIMDSLASLSLATEKPTIRLLKRKPYGRKSSLMSRIMMRNIIGQSLYQMAVLIVILFEGDKWFGFTKATNLEDMSVPNDHFTMIFNSLVVMTLFNEINARKLHNERNIFQGIFTNAFFYIIWVLSFALQVIFVQFGGRVFETTPLSGELWGWCLFLGVTVLIWGQVICTIKVRDIHGTVKDPKSVKAGSVLWVRGLTRLETQLKVVNTLSMGRDLNMDTYSSNSVEGIHHRLSQRSRQVSFV